MLETMDSGEMSYMGEKAVSIGNDGKSVYAKADQLKKIKSYFGLVFQNFNLFPHYSVMKNITDAPIRVQKREKEEVYEEAKKLLTKMGLADKADAYPYQLSGGQQQRVGVARALVVDPKIIFADEPTGNLDSHTSKEVMELMQKVVREQKKTLVMVTHDNHLASYADRIFHIIDGEIVKIEDNRTKGEEKEDEKD